jgi:hypothetical protein
MSGQLIGGIVGAAIGFFTPIGPVYGYAIGAAIGGLVAPGSGPDGPRLEDLTPQASEYGKPIPIVYGTVGIQGNVIWASDYVEEEGEEGGKGGSSGGTTYTYYGNFAVAFAEGEASIGRMWAGPEKRLIYDGMILEGGGSVRIYNGTEDQLPDPLIESYLGVGNVPAYRGTCYVVFERFPLVKDGNMIPFITAEVGAKAGAHGQEPTYLGETLPTPDFRAAIATVEPTNGWIWNVVPDGTEPAASYSVTVINDDDQSVVATFPNLPLAIIDGYIAGITAVGGLVYVVMAQFPHSRVGSTDWASRLAFVDVFSAGAANPDGTTDTPPAFVKATTFGSLGIAHNSWFYFGGPDVGVIEVDEGTRECDPYGPGGPLLGPQPGGTRTEGILVPEAPTNPCASGTDGARLWIAYCFSNTSDTTVAAYSTSRAFDSVAIGAIGSPYQVLGDATYMGVAGAGGGAENFAILSAAGAPSLLHAVSVPAAGQGKAFDYDPKRQVFLSYELNSTHWYAIDAATGAITERTLTVGPGDTSPAPTPYITAVSYSAKTDKYLFGSTSGFAGTGTTIYVVNPDSGLVEGTYTFEEGGQLINPLLDPVAAQSSPPYVLSFDQGNVKRLYLGGAAVAAPMNLGAIVADLSSRAGLTAEQIDVTALTDMVDGYANARQTTVRSAIDALRPAYYFDAVESGGKVKYVKRGGESVAVIEDDDLDARQADSEAGDPLQTTRQMEVELPRILNVNYLLAAADYSASTKIAKRLVGASGEETTLDLPLVLSDTKAQEVAEVNLHVPWVQRLSYAFTLPRTYSWLEPTDIVTVKGYDMILTKITATPGGLLKCEAVATDSSHYVPHVVVTETVPTEKLVAIPGETHLELM